MDAISEPSIRFDDGDAYERSVGVWSRLVGDVFLDWLTPPDGARWLDVGCGTGVFTELIAARCAPAAVEGLDPSEPLLAYARGRPGVDKAQFRQGDAMRLPCPDNSCDAAVMALVIFFVPEPARGVAEMARVVRPGGSVSAYAWDIGEGGLPIEPTLIEMRAIGFNPPLPPKPEVARIPALREMWAGAGLEAIETRQITVQRRAADFDEYWTATASTSTVGSILKTMSESEIDHLKLRVRSRVTSDGDGPIIAIGRANAIKGRRPQ